MHADGDYHGAVHVWIYVESTGELLLQKRADRKDSWPGLWDISSAGHISAGDTSLITARQAPRPSPFLCVCVCVSDPHKVVMTALVVILTSIFLFVEILLEFHRYVMLPSAAVTGENCRKSWESHYHLRLLNCSLFIFNNGEA